MKASHRRALAEFLDRDHRCPACNRIALTADGEGSVSCSSCNHFTPVPAEFKEVPTRSGFRTVANVPGVTPR